MSAAEKPAGKSLRTAYLLRIHSYADSAVLSMLRKGPRTDTMLGMVEASLRGGGPGGEDAAVLETLRPLVAEARAYFGVGESPAAVSRMRVAYDVLALYLIRLADD